MYVMYDFENNANFTVKNKCEKKKKIKDVIYLKKQTNRIEYH